jgi:hypothetical protein
MHPIQTVKGFMGYMDVFADRILIHPTGIAGVGRNVTEILFRDIVEVYVKEPTLMSTNGFIHFLISGREQTAVPSTFNAVNDVNTLVYRKKSKADLFRAKEFIEAKILEINNGSVSEEVLDTEKFFGGANPCNVDDYQLYKTLTKQRDWNGIAELNLSDFEKNLGVSKEFSVLHEYLRDDEVVFSFVSGLMGQTDTSNFLDLGLNTWLCVMTNKRILALDHAMLSSSVDTQTIRHEKIQAISASQGIMFGKVIIDIGNRSIVIDNCEKQQVKKFASIANDWLETIQEESSSSTHVHNDPIAELGKLAELKATGVLDEDEFAAAKAKILDRI